MNVLILHYRCGLHRKCYQKICFKKYPKDLKLCWNCERQCFIILKRVKTRMKHCVLNKIDYVESLVRTYCNIQRDTHWLKSLRPSFSALQVWWWGAQLCPLVDTTRPGVQNNPPYTHTHTHHFKSHKHSRQRYACPYMYSGGQND